MNRQQQTQNQETASREPNLQHIRDGEIMRFG